MKYIKKNYNFYFKINENYLKYMKEFVYKNKSIIQSKNSNDITIFFKFYSSIFLNK